MAPGEMIHQGQKKSFTYTVQAPAVPGTYAFQWKMVQDTTGTFPGGVMPATNIVVQ